MVQLDREYPHAEGDDVEGRHELVLESLDVELEQIDVIVAELSHQRGDREAVDLEPFLGVVQAGRR